MNIKKLSDPPALLFDLDEDLGRALAANVSIIMYGDGGAVVIPRRPDNDVAPKSQGTDLLSGLCGEAQQHSTTLLLERIAIALENGGASQGRGPRAQSGLITKAEAARFVGVSERSFERRVMRDLSAVRIGRRSFYDLEEIERWLAGQKDGSSRSTSGRRSTWSASPSAVDAVSAARANAILAELRSPPRSSTQRKSKKPSEPSTRQPSPHRNRRR